MTMVSWSGKNHMMQQERDFMCSHEGSHDFSSKKSHTRNGIVWYSKDTVVSRGYHVWSRHGVAKRALQSQHNTTQPPAACM